MVLKMAGCHLILASCNACDSSPSQGEKIELASSLDLLQLESQVYVPEHALVAKVNSDKSSKWKAKVYPHLMGRKLSELHNMGGMRPVEDYKALHVCYTLHHSLAFTVLLVDAAHPH